MNHIIKLALTKKPNKQALDTYRKAISDHGEALNQVSLTHFKLEEAEEKLLQSIFSQITDIERKGILFELGYDLPRDIR
jgi:hypothetical protein